MGVEYFICARYLRSGNRHSLTHLVNILSVLGIAVSVMVLVVITSVSNGFESEFKDRILSVDPDILVVKHEQFIDNYRRVAADLIKIDGVEIASPVVYSPVVFRGKAGISGAILKGIELEKTIFSRHILIDKQRGCCNFIDFKKKGTKNTLSQIMLGTVLASKLGVSFGDIVYLLSPNAGIEVPFFIPFEVVSLISTGIYQYDEMLAYAHISDAQNVLNIDELANSIELKVNSPYEAGKIAEKVRDSLGFAFLVRDWTEINANLFFALKIQKSVMFVVLFLIVLIAALNVVAAMIMMVFSKMSDIAILRAIGISKFTIRKIFILRGMAMGFIGIISGTAAGLFICELLNRYNFIDFPEDVYSLSALPVDVRFDNLVSIQLTTLIICLLFSIYPAYKASLFNFLDGIDRR